MFRIFWRFRWLSCALTRLVPAPAAPALRSQGTVKWARAAERSFSSEACHLRDELVGGQSWILHVPGGSSGWLLNFTAKRGGMSKCPSVHADLRASP